MDHIRDTADAPAKADTFKLEDGRVARNVTFREAFDNLCDRLEKEAVSDDPAIASRARDLMIICAVVAGAHDKPVPGNVVVVDEKSAS